MSGLRGRRTIVTDEPMRIAPELMGRPLGSVRRRFAALFIDVILFTIVVFTLVFLISLLNLRHRDKGFVDGVIATYKLPAGPKKSDAQYALFRDFLDTNIDRGQMRTGEAEILDAILDDDRETFHRRFGDLSTVIRLSEHTTHLVPDDTGVDMVIGTDVLFGRFSNLISLGTIAIIWFTLWMWGGRGRTPGKRLFGLWIVRLDGRPLRLWDAFGRAGGYSASTATLFLGFLEAAWHPNRQALHDKISGTVVLRTRRLPGRTPHDA